jgi:hypothetical protein
MSSTVAAKRGTSIHRLKKEMARLSEQQTEAMKMARLGGLTMKEVKQYAARHSRIIHLLRELSRHESV